MTQIASIIADHPPSDGREWDCQCAHCGSSCGWSDCWDCGGHEGFEGEPCSTCKGRGGWYVCLSGSEWCDAHPLPGRTTEMRNQIEWFTHEPAQEARTT